MPLTLRTRRRLLDHARVAFATVLGPALREDGMSRNLPLTQWIREYLPHFAQVEYGQFQTWMCGQLDSMRHNRGTYLNVLAPRGHAKSVLATMANPLRCALEATEPYIWIVSVTQDKAQQELNNIRRQIENNDAIRRAYPAAAEIGKPWRTDAITLSNGVRIEAHSMRQEIRGRREEADRPSLIVCDDIQGDEAMNSAGIREDDRTWFDGALLPAGNQWTNVINVGTALHRECISMWLEKAPGWQSHIWRAVIEWPKRLDLWKQWEGLFTRANTPEEYAAADSFFYANRAAMTDGAEVLWPQWEDLLALMKLRESRGHASFEREKQMVPVNPEVSEWPAECFEDFIWDVDNFEGRVAAANMRVVAVDPSKGKDVKEGDYSAIVGVAIGKPYIYVKSDLARRSPSKIVEDLFLFCEQFDHDYLAFETNQFQELFLPEIYNYAKKVPGMKLAQKLKRGDQIIEIDSRGNKKLRIRRLSQYLTRREFRFERSVGNAILIDQLRDFPDRDAHDDGPDALEMATCQVPYIVMGQSVPEVSPIRMASGV